MEVHIQDVIATVRAVSTDSVLTQRSLEKIMHTVVGAMRADQQHRDRLMADRRVASGVRTDHEGEA
jgi:hypothetical protein